VSCGQENPEGFRLCGMCGATLVAPAPERRKPATLLFCDVSGSTALGERLDAEAVRELMFRTFHELRSSIEHHGGTVEKFVGDAVMAAFGVPQAHEDDALRACRAAIEMQQRMRELNPGLERSYGVTLALRIGLSTGEVVAGDASARETFVSGDAVNTAARIEQAAQPGEVLLGQRTYGLAAAGIEAEQLPAIEAKGKAEPVPVWRLLSVLAAPRPHLRATPFIGRHEELAALVSAFDRAASERRCLLATVVGEPGVGKSRLASELQQRVGQRARVLSSRCLAYGEGITYWPLAEMVRGAAQIREEHSREQARLRVHSLVEPAVADTICALVGLSDETLAPEQAPWAFSRLLESLAAERPLVVIVEDVHWAEEALLDLLAHAAERCRAPALLLTTGRPDLLEGRPDWPVSVRLEPLAEGETQALLAASALDALQREAVVRRSGGNPLFAEQLSAYLREAPNGEGIPPTLEALLAARLDRLPEPERSCAERGAVEGELFHRGAACALASRDVTSELEALAGRELIHPAKADFEGEAAYRFAHALVRDAAYAGTAKRLRAELHERFAAWLEAKAGDRLPELEAILGYHLEQAYRYRVVLGPPDEHARELAARAAQRLGSSGRRAFAHGDEAGAVTLLERALSLLPPDDALRLDLLGVLAEALAETGQFERAERTTAEMLEPVGADPRVRAHALVVQMLILFRTQPERALSEIPSQVERAIAVFESVGDELGLAKSWRLLAAVPFMQAQAAETEAALLRAAEHARRAGDRREELYNLRYLAEHAWYGRIPAEDALRRCDEILGRAAGSPSALAEILLQRARAEAMLGRLEDARASLSRARAIQGELGLAWGLAYASVWRGSVELEAGDATVAVAELQRGYEQLLHLGDYSGIARVACMLARALYEEGRDAEAERLTETAEQQALSFDVVDQVLWRAERAKLLARRREFNRGEALAQEAVTLARQSDWLNLQAQALMSLAEVLRLDHRMDEAARAAEEAARLYERKGNLVSARRVRAQLAELETLQES
jgi:class 3 adenylate cyclase/predicted ATPase